MKRIAILFVLTAFLLFSLAGCSDKQTLSDTTFPDDVEFVVVDALPESETVAQSNTFAGNVCVSATFVDGDAPVCALPVVLFEGDSAIFSSLTDEDGRIACGSLPADTVIRFSVIVSEGSTVSFCVRFPSFGQDRSPAYAGQNVAVILPIVQVNGVACADLLFLLNSAPARYAAAVSAASDAVITPVFDPLHLWSRATLPLS